MKLASFLLIARPTEQKIEKIRSYGLTDEQIEQVIQTDPTEKDYCDWLARMVKKNLIRLPEDSEKLKKQLEAFQKLKSSPNFKGEKDIARYTPATLYEVVGGNEKGEVELPWEQLSEKEKERRIKEQGPKIVNQLVTTGETPGASTIVNALATVTYQKANPNYQKLKYNDPNYWSEENQRQYLPAEEELQFQIFKVTDFKVLMALSEGTNWCTKGEQHATQYLEAGPNYVFYLAGKPFAQMDPDTKQFMNVQDRPFARKPSKYRGYFYVDDPILSKFIRLFVESGEKIPSVLKPYSRSQEDIEKIIQEKEEKGQLTLSQKVEKNGWKALQLTPEEVDNLAKHGPLNDILYFAEHGLRAFKEGKTPGYRSKYDPTWMEWPEAEPRMLATMTSLKPVLNYANAVHAPSKWPELKAAALNLLRKEKKGSKQREADIEAYMKTWAGYSAPFEPELLDILLDDNLTQALIYIGDKKVKRSPAFEKCVIEQKEISIALNYFAGWEKPIGGSKGKSYYEHQPGHIAPNRWPELENLLSEQMGDTVAIDEKDWKKKGERTNLPNYIDKYLKACKDKFAWPEYEQYTVDSVAANRELMEKETDRETLNKGGTVYGTGKNAYENALNAIVSYCLERDLESPAVDKELAWLAKFWKQKKVEINEINQELKKKYEAEKAEKAARGESTWVYENYVKIEFGKALIDNLKEYKSRAWDRKFASRRRALRDG